MKKNTLTTFFLGLLLVSIVMTGCSGSSENSIEDQINKKEESKVKVSKESIDQLIQSFPSPIETSIIIKRSS